MKKFLIYVLSAAVLTLSVIGFTACKNGKQADKVNLVAITGAQVGVVDDIDYFVVPEPAASAKVSAVSSLDFAGDLQQLYGGENGYPQAVIVAKTQLCNSSFCGRFLNEIQQGCSWLLDDKTSAQTITSAVQSHLTEGLSPKFNANNLSKQVIKNCGVRLTSALDCKREILDFIQKLNSVSEQSFGEPSDSFFVVDGGDSAVEYQGKVKVYAPDGAPALGLAKLMAEEVSLGENVETEYNIVDASLIQTFVTGANPQADICVLPVNLAVKLLGSGDKYKMLGTLTHGNLYLLSKNGEKITSENISSLKGKTVGVVNLAAVPGLTFKLILKNHGVEYSELV
ncbi:MAG: hypothetical protein K2I30_05760 [Clostridia bacterium]|nr:hypothetical protein [Clostridia bacterium]